MRRALTSRRPTGAFERIRAYVDHRRLTPGDRLPPERQLSETLGLSRAELRKGLALMEVNGELERRVGRGTYLLPGPSGPAHGLNGHVAHVQMVAPAPNGQSGRISVTDLAERTSPHSAMVARLALEPQVAGLAAVHATPQQLSSLAQLVEGMRDADRWDDYEALDARFHDSLGEASGNVLLAELQRTTNAVRVNVVWSQLKTPDTGPPPDYPSFAEHDAILAAVRNRDRVAAQNAMRAHLKSIGARLLTDD